MPTRSLYRLVAALFVLTGSTLLLWGVGCKMKRVHIQQGPVQAPPQLFGGKEAYVVSRLQDSTSGSPEFLSMTVLPGRGMNIYQITAYLPSIGVTNLLVSPPIEQAGDILNGKGKDSNGESSTLVGGAFLLPFANPIHGPLSADKQLVLTNWDGKPISLPVGPPASAPGAMPASTHGLILNRAIEGQIEDAPLLDGHELTATMHGGSYDGHWPSTSDIQFKFVLTPRAIDMNVSVINTGTEPEPVSIGWMPYLAIPSGQRAQARLHIPAGQRIETTDSVNRIPTGKLLPVAGTPYDYSLHTGMPLNNLSINDDFVALKSTVFDTGPTIELMDPASSYGLRMICRSMEIKSIHVYAPADKNYVVLQPQFAYLDPFNKVWKNTNNGLVTLQPGQTIHWSIRLEFYTPVSKNNDMGLE